MRYRTKTTLHQTDMVRAVVQDGRSPTYLTNQSSAVPEETQHTYDTITPMFRRRQARGEVIVNSMSSSKSSVVGDGHLDYTLEDSHLENGVWVPTGITRVWCVTGFTPRFRLPYTSIADRCEQAKEEIVESFHMSGLSSIGDQVLARALASANDSDAQALVIAAEYEKTASYFMSLGQQARSLVIWLEHLKMSEPGLFRYLTRDFNMKAMRKGLPKAALSVASAWLGYRYGLMNTYYDLVSLVKGSGAAGKPRRVRYYARTTDSWSSGLITTRTASGWYADEYLSTRLTRVTEISAGVYVKAELSDLSQTLGLNQPFSSIWELVPWSFAIDWFIDVGNRIKAAEGVVLRPILGSWLGYHSTLTEFRGYEEIGKDTIIGNDRHRAIQMTDHASILDTAKVITRVANPTLSIIPSVNIKFNPKRIADGIALLVQQSQRLRSVLR